MKLTTQYMAENVPEEQHEVYHERMEFDLSRLRHNTAEPCLVYALELLRRYPVDLEGAALVIAELKKQLKKASKGGSSITLRDHLAGQAVSKDLADSRSAEELARRAYEIADMMLRIRTEVPYDARENDGEG